jgi:hypothetical protein
MSVPVTQGEVLGGWANEGEQVLPVAMAMPVPVQGN